MGSHVNFPPKFQYARGGAQKRQFVPQTSSYRAYTLPTSSDGADHWRILQLSAWAFQACMGLLVNLPPKFWYAWGGAQKRQFVPQTSPYRAYTLPTSSDGADDWCTLQLSAWAFWVRQFTWPIPTKNSVWAGECVKTEIWTFYVMESGIYFPPGLCWP